MGFDLGDEVTLTHKNWKGKTFPGTVVYITKTAYTIKIRYTKKCEQDPLEGYEVPFTSITRDGFTLLPAAPKEEAKEQETVRAAPEAQKTHLQPQQVQHRVGDEVEAEWENGDGFFNWYPASILKVNPDETYEIDWDGENTITSNHPGRQIRLRKCQTCRGTKQNAYNKADCLLCKGVGRRAVRARITNVKEDAKSQEKLTPESVIPEIEHLRKENESLKEQQSAHKTEVAHLRKENESLKGQHSAHKEETERLRGEIEDLREANQVLEAENSTLKASMGRKAERFRENLHSMLQQNGGEVTPHSSPDPTNNY